MSDELSPTAPDADALVSPRAGAFDEPGESSGAAVAPDHATIAHLADDLLPALVGRLAATGLGEIEVREGTWRLRVRRPAVTAGAAKARRATDRPSRAQPGHEGHGHAPGAVEGHRSARAGQVVHSTNGSGAGEPVAVGPGAADPSGADARRDPLRADPHRVVATSPAVGVFQIRAEARPGSRVRAGDRIAAVDVLGVPQEVVAPADGIIAAVLVDSGDAVEYGEELVAIELMTHAGGGPA